MQPIVWPLVNVESATDFDTPAVAQFNFTVVQAWIDADLKAHV
jgi:hypothetical protein